MYDYTNHIVNLDKEMDEEDIKKKEQELMPMVQKFIAHLKLPVYSFKGA